jgi:muramoyltetrapeptide carboxypeptidase
MKRRTASPDAAATLRRPPAIGRGARVAVVAPASPFAREDFDAGVAEIARLGFEPVVDERVFARERYVSGPAALRAQHLTDAWRDPSIDAIICARGGYGSVQVLPLLDPAVFRDRPKIFIGYSDVTTLLTWLTQAAGLVVFHGPMLAGRLSHGTARYDEASLRAAVSSSEPLGPLTSDTLEVVRPGEASGLLVGGTLTQLAASLGTPFAFDPPAGHVLFLDEVNERPYRVDRMLMQLLLSGIVSRAGAIVFNELPNCDEPDGGVRAIDAIRDVLQDFPGPILTGFPSGHTPGAAMTLPFGVRATVIAPRSGAGGGPALVVEEAAVA